MFVGAWTDDADHVVELRLGGTSLPSTRAQCPPPGQCRFVTCRQHLQASTARNQHGPRGLPVVVDVNRPTCCLDIITANPEGLSVAEVARVVGRSERSVLRSLARVREATDAEPIDAYASTTELRRAAIAELSALDERVARLRTGLGEDHDYEPRDAREE